MAAACLLIASEAPARLFFQQPIGTHEIELELDSYYSDLAYYVPLTGKPIPCVQENNEFEIYKNLLLSPVPRFLVVELSANPLPLLGVWVKHNYPGLYRRADVSENFNLIRSATAGFEEPAATSLFLGNVVSFKPAGDKDCEGKGYVGTLFSFGNYHIQDNDLIDDKWHEVELKFKGDRIVPDRRMSWSCRLGAKYHGNPWIKDAVYFSLRRDRLDYLDQSLDLLKNGSVAYTIDLSFDSGEVLRHTFKIGKKMPLKSIKVAGVLYIGMIWENHNKYTGPLERKAPGDIFQVILQPNIEF